ncbi:TfoX protein [Mergibacter septicus]|uniref:TfoX protein n=1 Tax=Mergibacter septicus TaxID=221402 RepID=A0A8E3ME10_9PAST|nr:TfoX/Sxy family protein [Mergibacter septicus]AWX16106.1 TfoX protein [Mergibacter septicus]QDJ13560.1 TfoX protein [Mergibacter septicus]QDJ15359.1 TfoX protein [Mergibacter septicus]UTU48772.1 TfoX/Sxy family DNA transformation protein [Mergibacter septicus]WMR95597.1 TfoX/Sxy family protein [Mergibacter septicus]
MNITNEKTVVIRNKIEALIGTVTAKNIFGGYGIFKDKKMFGIYHNNKFYLRATGEFINTLYQLKGKKYKSSMKEIAYISIPIKVMKNTEYFKNLILYSISQIKSENKKIVKNKKSQIKELANLNFKYERLLNKIGINGVKEFRRYGAIHTYILLLKANVELSLDIFWRLIAAIENRHYSLLTIEEKKKHLKVLNHHLRLSGIEEIKESSLY